MTRRATLNRRGLTFVEVLLVIVIMLVLLAVALPNMSGPRDRMALRSATRDLATGGMLARQMAISYGESTYLVIDPENNQWWLELSPDAAEVREQRERVHRRARRVSDAQGHASTSEERIRDLPIRTEFVTLMQEGSELALRDKVRVTFYPNGMTDGIAIEVENGRGDSSTVEFEAGMTRPEIYAGSPRSPAERLRAMGLNPADYGIAETVSAENEGRAPGEGFYQSAGWTSEERVAAYKDAVDRMVDRSRTRFEAQEAGGPAAYYREASRWGR